MKRELLIETDADAIAYGFDLMADLAKVRAGQKPLCIGSYGKCVTACVALEDIVRDDPAIISQAADLVCEDGEIHRHVFVCGAGAPYASEAISAIFDTISEAAYTDRDSVKAALRKSLQLQLGLLLGHSAREAIDFTASELGRTCPCDCCGSEFTVNNGGIDVVEGGEHVTLASDPNPGRFVPNSYRY